MVNECDCGFFEGKISECTCGKRWAGSDVSNSIANLVMQTMGEWNTHYGMVKVNHVGTKYLIEFATGGWSENETTIEKINLFCSIKDLGGYFLMEVDSLFLGADVLHSFLKKIKENDIQLIEFGKKKFVYKFIRTKRGF